MRGGEIFVPKIPSMRVTDLAQAMAPQLPIRLVGIRPGEKLHEIMVTEDDARTTLEFADHYVIEPELSFWSRPETPPGAASPVEDGFSYASDTNSEWLDEAQLAAMLGPGTE
jgi:UDP-N-acetylglucosamine 4,6-dehydratase/5-epimerase